MDHQASSVQPDKKKSPGVLADEPMAEAGRKMLGFHFARMLAHEAGTRAGLDVEALHDMRVATRRQRAAFRLFAPYFDLARARPFRRGLRALAQRLGAVRDWDVLIEAVRAYQAALGAQAGALQPLLDAWGDQRQQARDLLLDFLDSADYAAFKEDYAAFLTSARSESAADGPPQPNLVRHALPGRVWDQYGVVRAYEGVLSSASLEQLHTLRIEVKRLRYALEFFREVLPPDIDEAIHKLVALQDHLGELHDTDVAIGLLRELRAGRKRTSEVTQATGHYLKAKKARLSELRRGLKKPWQEIMNKRFRSLLAKAVSML